MSGELRTVSSQLRGGSAMRPQPTRWPRLTCQAQLPGGERPSFPLFSYLILLFFFSFTTPSLSRPSQKSQDCQLCCISLSVFILVHSRSTLPYCSSESHILLGGGGKNRTCSRLERRDSCNTYSLWLLTQKNGFPFTTASVSSFSVFS